MFVNYNSYNSISVTASTTLHPYLLNQTYPLSGDNEASTENLIADEWYYLNGTDLVFLPREMNKEETTFGEYLSSVIDRGYPLRMFVEEVEAFSGNGDMYSKFGLQITDECTCYTTISFFIKQTNGVYPKQGDLLYMNKSKKLFQISHIENECQPGFYRLGNQTTYKIQCKMATFNHELINQAVSSGIPSAIQALDSLLADINGVVSDLPTKDYNQNNIPIITTANPIIDITESDPLLG